MSFEPIQCDRCERPWVHRPDAASTHVLSGHNYLCDEHYREVASTLTSREDAPAATFIRQEDGTYKQSGTIDFEFGRFQWLRDDMWDCWDGGWSIEPVSALLTRLHDAHGPAYRIVMGTKPELVIHPCCTSCGLPGDISKSYDVFGEQVMCCNYSDPKYGHRVDPSVPVSMTAPQAPQDFTTNDYGQIVAKGITGQFCSLYCFAMEMFLARNGRCGACAKRLPKKAWKAEKLNKRFAFCSSKCETVGQSLVKEDGILSERHIRVALGMTPKPRRLSARHLSALRGKSGVLLPSEVARLKSTIATSPTSETA